MSSWTFTLARLRTNEITLIISTALPRNISLIIAITYRALITVHVACLIDKTKKSCRCASRLELFRIGNSAIAWPEARLPLNDRMTVYRQLCANSLLSCFHSSAWRETLLLSAFYMNGKSSLCNISWDYSQRWLLDHKAIWPQTYTSKTMFVCFMTSSLSYKSVRCFLHTPSWGWACRGNQFLIPILD